VAIRIPLRIALPPIKSSLLRASTVWLIGAAADARRT